MKYTSQVPLYAPELPLLSIPKGNDVRIFTERQQEQWTKTAGDCHMADMLMPLKTMIEEYELPAGQFLNYKAVVRVFHSLWGAGAYEPQTHGVLTLLLEWACGNIM